VETDHDSKELSRAFREHCTQESTGNRVVDDMKQIKVRWGDLGSPMQIGTYRCGRHMVEVTPGDIKLAKDNPDTVFTAIHPNFFSAETPYLLTGVELPDRRGEVPTDSFHNTAGNQPPKTKIEANDDSRRK
jgi:hypothetical protein